MFGGMVGFYYGRAFSEDTVRPQFRIVLASIIIIIWGASQTISLAFGTRVDPWLNAIMGAVAGFFFGDGIVETIKSK